MARMEKRIPALKLLLSLLLILLPLSLFAQTLEALPRLRIQLWVPSEEDPARHDVPEDGEPFYMPAIRNIKTMAPYVLEGMLYGWDVTYSPADPTRGIAEFFECTPKMEVSVDDPAIEWSDAQITSESLSCWINYDRSDAQMLHRRWWNSINNVKISGKGEAPAADGPDGMKAAIEKSMKAAIRAYLQKTQKNRPKEMTGSVLLLETTPRIYIDHGQYVADLDFFLYVDTIEQYSYY